jgi:hypothetical protein
VPRAHPAPGSWRASLQRAGAFRPHTHPRSRLHDFGFVHSARPLETSSRRFARTRSNEIISGASRTPLCDSMSKRAEAPSMVMSPDLMAGNCLSVLQVSLAGRVACLTPHLPITRGRGIDLRCVT